jgi:lipopolysaccharide/colanic/teichoic acid biosynthesis glycosyltransferase
MSTYHQPHFSAGAILQFKVFAERLVEVFAALMAILFFSPTFLIASFLIVAESPGPLFCTEIVYIPENRAIRIRKFRTNNGAGSCNSTRIGHLLRGTGIESLPVLFGLLMGELSMLDIVRLKALGRFGEGDRAH